MRSAAPLLFAAMGETVCEQAGLANIGLEGTMLMGAWAGFIGMWASGSWAAGLGAAMLGGMAMTAVLGFGMSFDQKNYI